MTKKTEQINGIEVIRWTVRTTFQQVECGRMHYMKFLEDVKSEYKVKSIYSMIDRELVKDDLLSNVDVKDVVHFLYVLKIKANQPLMQTIKSAAGSVEFDNKSRILNFRSKDGLLDCRDGRVTKTDEPVLSIGNHQLPVGVKNEELIPDQNRLGFHEQIRQRDERLQGENDAPHPVQDGQPEFHVPAENTRPKRRAVLIAADMVQIKQETPGTSSVHHVVKQEPSFEDFQNQRGIKRKCEEPEIPDTQYIHALSILKAMGDVITVFFLPEFNDLEARVQRELENPARETTNISMANISLNLGSSLQLIFNGASSNLQTIDSSMKYLEFLRLYTMTLYSFGLPRDGDISTLLMRQIGNQQNQEKVISIQIVLTVFNILFYMATPAV